MADRECVLCYLTFSIRSVAEYHVPDLDKFLSKMGQLNKAGGQSFVGYRTGFEQAMERAFWIFGGLAFRGKRRGRPRKFPIN